MAAAADADGVIRSIQSARKSNFLPFSSSKVHPQIYTTEHCECVRVDKNVAQTHHSFSTALGWVIILSNNIGNTNLSSWRSALFSELQEEVFKQGVNMTTIAKLFQQVEARLSSKIKDLEAIEPEPESDEDDEESMKTLKPEHWRPHVLSSLVAIKDGHVIVGGPGPFLIAVCGKSEFRVISSPDSGSFRAVEGRIGDGEYLLLLPREFKDVNKERIVAAVKANHGLLDIAQALLQLSTTNEGICLVVLKVNSAASAA